MNKTKYDILKVIKEKTSADVFNLGTQTNQVTADSIAELLHISRSSASQYLNELFKENKLIKISTRPVLFLHKDVVSIAYGFTVAENDFINLSALDEYIVKNASLDLNEFIGGKGSLKQIIDTALATVSYPPYGIEILIIGNYSSGRSLLAEEIFNQHYNNEVDLSVTYQKLACEKYLEEGDFIEDLAELVTTTNDRSHNIIYLDEVHSLSNCNLEKLKNLILSRNLMINGVKRTVTSRFILSTLKERYDEKLQNSLSYIAAQMNLSEYSERPKQERELFVLKFFTQEAIHLSKRIYLTKELVKHVKDNTYPYGLQGLENYVKMICAMANYNKTGDDLYISLADIPTYDKTSAGKLDEDYILVSEY